MVIWCGRPVGFWSLGLIVFGMCELRSSQRRVSCFSSWPCLVDVSGCSLYFSVVAFECASRTWSRWCFVLLRLPTFSHECSEIIGSWLCSLRLPLGKLYPSLHFSIFWRCGFRCCADRSFHGLPGVHFASTMVSDGRKLRLCLGFQGCGCGGYDTESGVWIILFCMWWW